MRTREVERPALPVAAEVSVWHAHLDVTPSCLALLEAMLADDERARAARFVFDRDRRRFVAARGLLRRILGSALDLEPARVRIEYGERGKPRLAAQGEQPLHFNVAHSQGHGLFAITWGAELGADIEVLRPLPGAMAIAERFFSADERSQLLAQPVADREAAFFRCWTRKEACIKALGTGLAHPLDCFSVSLEPGGAIELVDHDPGGHMRAWSVHDVSHLPTYAAAVALRSGPREWRVQLREWPAGDDPAAW